VERSQSPDQEDPLATLTLRALVLFRLLRLPSESLNPKQLQENPCLARFIGMHLDGSALNQGSYREQRGLLLGKPHILRLIGFVDREARWLFGDQTLPQLGKQLAQATFPQQEAA
jgi:hypothetical protein